MNKMSFEFATEQALANLLHYRRANMEACAVLCEKLAEQKPEYLDAAEACAKEIRRMAYCPPELAPKAEESPPKKCTVCGQEAPAGSTYVCLSDPIERTPCKYE